MTILISTIWKGSAVIQAIKLFSPNKIYFLVDDPINDIMQNSLIMIRNLFPDIFLKNIPTKMYDIVDVTKNTSDIIIEEKTEKIIIHISEGRKTRSLGLLFGAYLQKEYVDSAYYITEETNTPLQLPLMELKVSKQKKQLLRNLENNINFVSELEKKLNLKAQTIYVYMKELRDNGFLNRDNKLTEMGRIVLLKN